MSDRIEMLLFLAAIGTMLMCYLTCGAFLAWLIGLDEGVTWWLFVVAWPVPMGAAMLMAIFTLTISISCARALVR